ncbi:MAG: hypothetical protein AAFR59_00015 [Bacteroidota bacterium]
MQKNAVIRFFLGSLIFFLVGEILIRLDEHFGFFQESKVVKIAETLTVSPILEAVDKGTYPIQADEFRIMVIGDSYINGGGIPKDSAFARKLEAMLQTRSSACYSKVTILDVSRPNNNMLDNYLIFHEYVDRFPPHLVILGYNFNDVQGMLEIPDEEIQALSPTEFNATEVNVSFVRKVYEVVYTSRLLRFVMKQFNIRLKAEGIFLPGSEFSRIMKRYDKAQDAHKQVQTLIDGIVDKLQGLDSHLFFYYMPEINLIEHAGVFEEPVVQPSQLWITAHTKYATYLNGYTAFEGEKAYRYTLSKYDGHANPAGHERLAAFIMPSVEVKIRETCP